MTSYEENIRIKNHILSFTVVFCVILRSVVNAFFIGFAQVIPMMIFGLGVGVVLWLLSSKINPKVMMYLMVAFFSTLCFLLMILFPSMTNLLMFFLAVFMIVIYEDIVPITIQCVVSITGIIWSYIFYRQNLEESTIPDVIAMSVVYIISGLLVFISLCRLNKKQFNELEEASNESRKSSEQADRLLEKIRESVGVLGTSNSKINQTVSSVGQISGQIANATNDVANAAVSNAEDTTEIKSLIDSGTEHVQMVSEQTQSVSEAAQHTSEAVRNGGEKVNALTEEMGSMEDKMNDMTDSIGELSRQMEQISDILEKLNEITSETNLLSLNASIEAARAGEAGRGFAVVASSIRGLSDNSAESTSRIDEILTNIQKQTNIVKNEISEAHTITEKCSEHVHSLDESFSNIASNNDIVESKVGDMKSGVDQLSHIMSDTMNRINGISDNISSTSAAMQEITANVSNLNSSIDNVVEGYNDIDRITNDLVSVSGEK